MPTNLGPIRLTRKTGTEPFVSGDETLDFDLHGFWTWAYSDLVGNTVRGVLAEYVVARALGGGVADCRIEWNPYDLESASGITIEVKSAAYIQSWHQSDYSKISFSVGKKRTWDPVSKVYSDEPKRYADVYVFALLAHKEQETLNPMNMAQWEFYVVPTSKLGQRKRSQSSITLSSLKREFGVPVSFEELSSAVVRAATSQQD